MKAVNTAISQLEVTAGDGIPAREWSLADAEFWINCIGTPVFLIGKNDLDIRSANKAAEPFWGYAVAQSRTMRLNDVLGDEASAILSQIWSVGQNGEIGDPFLVRSRVADAERLLKVQISRISVDGEVLRLMTISDAPPQGEAPLGTWQEKIIDLLNWIPFGLEIADHDDQIQFANSQFFEIFGYSQGELDDVENWWQLAYPDEAYREFARSKWNTEIASARSENREMVPFDLNVATAYGHSRTIQFRHRSIGDFHVNLYLDVTKDRAYAQELKRLADTDPLTGILNRRQFFLHAEETCRAREDHPYAILMLDIDHFKAINDSYGHGVGDLVLQEFVFRVQHVLTERDSFARMGGEEFCALLDCGNAEEALSTAEKIRAITTATPIYAAGQKVGVTVSVGIAMLARINELEATLASADKALYEAKLSGRNRVVLSGGDSGKMPQK